MNLKTGGMLLAVAVALRMPLVGAPLVVELDHTNGVYRVGETAHWTVKWDGETNTAPVHYRLMKGQWMELSRGELQFSNGMATLTTPLPEAGTVLGEFKWTNGSPCRALAGLIVSPGEISLSASRPADFDAFWAGKINDLAQIPVNAQLEEAATAKTNLSYWKITMDNIRGSHIYGQLARPRTGSKFPALLIVQWAGVYGLQQSWVTDRAADGWLVLNIEPHDLPFDKPESFYKEQAAGPLKNYWNIGNDDRETSYYLRMYLSCYRAADYLAHRDDWDGKTLVVMGGSQGGMQTLVTAAIYPKFTAALACVPAGCDMLGPKSGRKGGWPQWYSNTAGKDPEKVREASRYYDVANFTPSIRCPVLIGAGLIDDVCPAAGIMAAANQIRGPKEVILMPHSGHQDEHGTQAAYNTRCYGDWLGALVQGKAAPVKSGGLE
ncbi:MAG: acetylxylan esterase [Verrucomicrobiota bacterium]